MSSDGPQREFSAGGVVVRNGDVAVIVPFRLSPDGKKVLALPKGHPDEGESMKEAAAREVREETGIEAELRDKLGDVEYWYQRQGRRVLKKVAFYLFDYRSGSLEDHDDEIQQARWMPLEQAARELSFPGEREMVARALSRLHDDR
jgi:8-oxo-dGTP pyrophosphatase MutT (NUDIX family)